LEGLALTRWTRFVIRNRKEAGAPRRAAAEPDSGFLDEQSFTAATERALGHDEECALVLIELSGLEDLLPELGGAADALVVAAENRLARAIRPGDLVGRVGYGRFALLSRREDGPEGVDLIAARLADRLGVPFRIGGRQVAVTPHIGVATSADGRTAAALLERAQASLTPVRGDSSAPPPPS
jgi:GGDEF domain-containing protein